MKAQELSAWFDSVRNVLENAYLAHEEPWMQSGMSGPEGRWISLLRPVADCMDCSGSVLDIGCANGYLLECCLKWTEERGLRLDPYGLDLSARLVELAYVPGEVEKGFIQRLLSDYIKPGGLLLITNYAEEHPNPEVGLCPGCYPTRRILDRLIELGFRAEQYRDGHDPIKGRKVRVAILSTS